MSLSTIRHLSVLNPESWRVLHKNVQTGSLLLQRKTVMRSCFDFVKLGHVFRKKSQQFELAEVRHSWVASGACMRENMWASVLERIPVFR